MRRPPAMAIVRPRSEPRPFVTVAERNYGQDTPEGQGFPIVVRWLDTIQINPALEQPRLILTSAAQPIIRWGARRWARTFMAMGPRYLGRYMVAGLTQRQFMERPRMTGVPVRGYTYQYPAPKMTPPRTVVIGTRR